MSHFKVTASASNRDSGLVSHHLGSNHRYGFTLSGVNLSRHDTAAGLVLRQAQFTQTASWTRSKEPDVVRNLHKRARKDVEGTVCLNEGVVRRESLELDG